MADYLTVPQTANECHVSTHTVRGWLRKKVLVKKRAGGRVLIERSDLEEFIRRSGEQTQQAKTPLAA